MRTRILTAATALLLSATPALAGSEGNSATYYGHNAGGATPPDANNNTFVGAEAAGAGSSTGANNTFFGFNAGFNHSSGTNNTFLGSSAGSNTTTGNFNTFVGQSAGGSNTGDANTYVGYHAGAALSGGSTGSGNVFLGYGAGTSETGSNKLYIDNCQSGGSCTSPFIYGEFDNHLLNVNGVLGISDNGAVKSQLHFSVDGSDVGGWITSSQENNLNFAGGATFDASGDPNGNWIQKSSDGNAVMLGINGALGFRVLSHSGASVGTRFKINQVFQVDPSGNLGIGMNTVSAPGVAITTNTGAILTAGGQWQDASSREYKENVRPLSTIDALHVLAALNPITYNYKVDAEEKHVGFIAEEVPDLVASKDRKSLSPLDIVAVLTKAVQQQQEQLREQARILAAKSRIIEMQERRIEMQQGAFDKLAATVRGLERQLNVPQGRN